MPNSENVVIKIVDKVKIERIGDFRTDPRNVNKGTPRGHGIIERSVRQHGAGRSGLAAKDGTMIAGSQTLEEMQALGMKVKPVHTTGDEWVVVVRDDIEPGSEQAVLMGLEDNRATQVGLDFDLPLLAELSQEIDLSGLWSDAELNELTGKLVEVGKDVEPQVDKAEELRQKWGVHYGQLWACGEHRLLCGDSTNRADVERVMGGEKADACISDPPYGINFDTDYRRFSPGLGGPRASRAPIANDDMPFNPAPFLGFAAVVLWGANFYAEHLPVGTWLVWDKRYKNGEAFLADGELAWMKGGKGVYIHSETSQGFVRPEPTQHPTQKPVSLLMWCIEKSKAGNLIFDPFSGSGTTLIACQNLQRKCRAIEISPGYVGVSLQRFFDATTITPTLL